MSSFTKNQKTKISETNFVNTKDKLEVSLTGVFSDNFCWFASPWYC